MRRPDGHVVVVTREKVGFFRAPFGGNISRRQTLAIFMRYCTVRCVVGKIAEYNQSLSIIFNRKPTSFSRIMVRKPQ